MEPIKLSTFIEKNKLSNIIKILIILILLFLAIRLFLPDFFTSITKKNNTKLIETFIQPIDNNSIYGNVLGLANPPVYSGNKCIIKLDGMYRIDTMIINFNNTLYPEGQDIFINFEDGNGKMKSLGINPISPGNGSPPNFKNILESKTLNLYNITDENQLTVFTSKITIIFGSSNSDSNNSSSYDKIINNIAIFGGDRTLPTLTDYNNLASSLKEYSNVFIKSNNDSSNADETLKTDKFSFSQSNDIMIYGLKLNYTVMNSQEYENADTTFNTTIQYNNTTYPNNDFTVGYNNNTTIYKIRIDTNFVNIYLTEPILANKLSFIVNRLDTASNKVLKLQINDITVIGKTPTSTDISNIKRNINLSMQSGDSDQNTNICPSINNLIDTQTKTQKICDNLEYQDKVKSEKLRLERNKQYLLKLKDQQEQLDNLNITIMDLETKRQSRANIADNIRVLQYQKQKADANTIRDLANQRLESQDNNKLYMDVNIN